MSSVSRPAVHAWLRSKHVSVAQDWLEACVAWILEESQDMILTQDQVNRAVYNQWLVADLHEIQSACLPPEILTKESMVLTGSYSVQVDSMLDISQPCYGQLQKITGAESENSTVAAFDKGANRTWEPKPTRVLLLSLTDGSLKDVQAFEYSPVPSLSHDLPVGTKVLLKGPLTCRSGVLLLTAANVCILGGEVEALKATNCLRALLQRALSEAGEERKDVPPTGGSCRASTTAAPVVRPSVGRAAPVGHAPGAAATAAPRSASSNLAASSAARAATGRPVQASAGPPPPVKQERSQHEFDIGDFDDDDDFDGDDKDFVTSGRGVALPSTQPFPIKISSDSGHAAKVFAQDATARPINAGSMRQRAAEAVVTTSTLQAQRAAASGNGHCRSNGPHASDSPSGWPGQCSSAAARTAGGHVRARATIEQDRAVVDRDGSRACDAAEDDLFDEQDSFGGEDIAEHDDFDDYARMNVDDARYDSEAAAAGERASDCADGGFWHEADEDFGEEHDAAGLGSDGDPPAPDVERSAGGRCLPASELGAHERPVGGGTSAAERTSGSGRGRSATRLPCPQWDVVSIADTAAHENTFRSTTDKLEQQPVPPLATAAAVPLAEAARSAAAVVHKRDEEEAAAAEKEEEDDDDCVVVSAEAGRVQRTGAGATATHGSPSSGRARLRLTPVVSRPACAGPACTVAADPRSLTVEDQRQHLRPVRSQSDDEAPCAVDSPPFTYLNRVKALLPTLVEPKTFVVKAYVRTLTGKLKLNKHHGWSLSACINDGSAGLEVAFSDEVLASLIGHSAREFTQLRKTSSDGGAEALARCQHRLANLSCLMEIGAAQAGDEANSLPRVCRLREVTADDVRLLRKRVAGEREAA